MTIITQFKFYDRNFQFQVPVLSDHTKKEYIISIRFETIIALWEGKTSKTSGLNANGMLTSVMVVECYNDQLNYQANGEPIIMRVHC